MKWLASLIAMAVLIRACPNNDEYCAHCVGSVCSVCFLSYIGADEASCVKSRTPVGNCLIYATNGYCDVCDDYYRATIDGRCVKSSIGCKQYNIIDGCVFCGSSIKVKNGECKSNNKCAVEFCEDCYEDDSCYRCKEGYTLANGGACSVSAVNLPNCSVVTENGCILCRVGYFSSNGECLPSSLYKSVGVLLPSIVILKLLMAN